jgi:predicted metalloprotease with PDZ domain
MFYNEIDDGESFLESFAFTLKDPIDQTNKIIWSNQMAHELFHYWNSDLIQARSQSERQWFSEGTAEYYANLTLVRQRIITESIFLSKVEKILGLYQNYRGWRETETSLLEAGKNKGIHRFLVYNGGWAVAMALDVEIMESTNGKKNLDDFMRSMFAKYTTKPYTYQDLVDTASEAGGIDLSPFFKKYVEGNELLPLNDYMDRLGYHMYDIIYEAEVYLVRKSNQESDLNGQWLRRKAKKE